jgi:hypothetical protein
VRELVRGSLRDGHEHAADFAGFRLGIIVRVWLRAFRGRADRETMRKAFYEGPEWTQELEGRLMPLLDGYASVLVEDRDGLWQRWPGQVSTIRRACAPSTITTARPTRSSC